MKDEEFMDQRVSEMNVNELMKAIEMKIKDRLDSIKKEIEEENSEWTLASCIHDYPRYNNLFCTAVRAVEEKDIKRFIDEVEHEINCIDYVDFENHSLNMSSRICKIIDRKIGNIK